MYATATSWGAASSVGPNTALRLSLGMRLLAEWSATLRARTGKALLAQIAVRVGFVPQRSPVVAYRLRWNMSARVTR